MKTAIGVMAALLLAAPVMAAPKSKAQAKTQGTFDVYTDKGARTNHFAPSGWMGDYGDIKINDGDTEVVADGKSSFKVTYSAKGTQGANWAGIYWQQPPNNWGEKPGGYDLTGMKRLVFWARGAEGGEKIAEFKTGGITGEHGDSDAANIAGIVLEKNWNKYTIDLADKNLSHWVGGFCWSASRDDNPNGFTIYLDNIQFEK